MSIVGNLAPVMHLKVLNNATQDEDERKEKRQHGTDSQLISCLVLLRTFRNFAAYSCSTEEER